LQLQTAQLGQGLLRRDGGGADTPFTRTMLARNFEQIAFFSEYDGGFSTAGGPSPLRRWGGPVHMEMIFGSSVPPSQRASDTANVRSFADRLARVTGHPVSMGRKPNFVVIVAGEDDRGAALAQAAAQLPGVTATSLEPLANLPRNSYCVVVTYSTGIGDNTYTAAIALIRAENPNFLRLSCIHEELAQGMGLANDSPAARPSIFNDDDEFARETVQTIAGELTNAGPV
jgi:hypothetical protein